jgi:AraC family transcriptional activator of pyochelin receptor
VSAKLIRFDCSDEEAIDLADGLSISMANVSSNRQIRKVGGSANSIYFPPSRLFLANGVECLLSPGTVAQNAAEDFAAVIEFPLVGNASVVTMNVRRTSLECSPASPVVCIEEGSPLLRDVPLDPGSWYLAPNLRSMLVTARQTELLDAREELHLRAKLLDLICCVIDSLRRGHLTPCAGSPELSENETRRILKARDFIHEHFGEELSLEAIGRASGTNRALLCRGFRIVFSMSVWVFLTEIRLQEAHELLTFADMTVAAVGYKCGYKNNAAFARAFARRFGVSPSAHRQDSQRLLASSSFETA